MAVVIVVHFRRGIECLNTLLFCVYNESSTFYIFMLYILKHTKHVLLKFQIASVISYSSMICSKLPFPFRKCIRTCSPRHFFIRFLKDKNVFADFILLSRLSTNLFHMCTLFLFYFIALCNDEYILMMITLRVKHVNK